MKELLSLILLDYRKTAEKCTVRLETEESGKVIASTQGELSCCKLFLKTFDKEFSSSFRYETLTLNEQRLPEIYTLRDKFLAALESQRQELEKDPTWETFLLKLESYEKQKKEWLYFSAEKGRDLDFVHGWRDCLKKPEELCNSIMYEYERRTKEREKEPELFPNDDLKLNVYKVDIVDLTIIEDDES